jgi:hypothetical protein
MDFAAWIPQQRPLAKIRKKKACDANGFAVSYVYYESEPGRRTAANLMTKDEARRIAANIAKLPQLLGAEPKPEGNPLVHRRPA